MPRKTRKQKIKVKLRKQKELALTATHREPQPELHKAMEKEEMKKVAAQPVTYSEALSIDEKRTLQYFTSDLRKSLFLIGSIIALEIVLYYGSMYTYLGTILTR